MPPAKCPNWNRCDKYTDLTRRNDRLAERVASLEREVARLKAENERLKAAQSGGSSATPPFGSSTPSSRIPLKANSTEENRARVGGRPAGHAGCGRKSVAPEDADERITLPLPVCPVTHETLTDVAEQTTRTVYRTVPARVVKQVFTRFRCWCPTCGKYHESEVPGVMPRFMFSNDLLAQALVDHYRDGIPFGTIVRRVGVKKSALLNAAHAVAEKLEVGADALLADFLAAPVKHADETTWPCDGRRGYVYGFFTPTVSLFRFRETRGKSVPEAVFGAEPHAGTLVVDRYPAYESTWKGPIQYCLEHYKRNVRDLLEAEPKNEEYGKFIPPFLALLAEAMTLRAKFKGRKKDDFLAEYRAEARRIRDAILALARSPVKDGRLKGYFDLVLEKPHRFFQWVGDPDVEAENNLAERRIRPLVIARKTSFGSQSEKGLKTRETLSSVVCTLALRCDDPVAKLSQVFDALARDPEADVAALLWGKAEA